MNRPKVKFCGITSEKDAVFAADLGVDFIGFIFADSERRISANRAKKIAAEIDVRVARIGIFVDEEIEKVLETVDSAALTGLQLHGRESSAYVRQIKAKRPDLLIIKAVEVDAQIAEAALADFECDYFLFDSSRKGTVREPFDIELVRALRIRRPFFLAGGLTSNNVRERCDALNPYAVDVSSGIEIRAGIKSPEAMNHFMDALSRRRP